MCIIAMFFYIYIIIIYSIYTCICLSNKDLLTETSLNVVSPSSIGLNFITKVNNTSDMDYCVEVSPDQCCLVLNDVIDCESVQVIGRCLAFVPKRTTKILNLIAPLINPLERYGYCTFYLDSYLNDKKRNVMRDEIKVIFDTRLNNKRQMIDVSENVKPCKHLDEDPINGCKPVDCDEHYNGVKCYYSKTEKRCIETPTCVNSETDDGDIIYDPRTNKCVTEVGISDEDLEYIKSLNNKGRHGKDILIIKNVEPTQDNDNIDKECPNCNSVFKVQQKTITHKYHDKNTMKTFIAYLMANKYILILLGLVTLIQCCLIFTMVYYLSKSCACCKRKDVESKYFNYRQDASVTTPLIYTSNNNTETTDYQFISDSSNVDKKIKCYKACQKERESNLKMSMSDDILSKCMNRRKWDRISKSDPIQEDIEAGRGKTDHVADKVTFDDNNHKNIDIGVNANEKSSKEIENVGVHNDTSEKEIKCHTYNCYDDRTNIVNSKTSGNDKNEIIVKNTLSNSTEKGAQACFSNDSIDDFLSDRGMMFLADGNISNSLLSSSEPVESTGSSLSCKTSKNNIVKNVFSFLSRRSKPCSVPGTRKSKENLDLELIHMSRATMLSSSSRSDNVLKRMKNSKTSF